MLSDDLVAVVKSWFAKAENDLRNIALVLPNPDCPYDTVCFHAQQAAEKYLKGLLSFHGVSFRKTHDLEELAALVPAGASLSLRRELLFELSQLAVVPRYPGFEQDVDKETAEEALRLAQQVKAAVLKSLAQKGFDLPEGCNG